ncbi:MAG TPA: ubiquinol-cytochrome c reductase iron-sulfur subunit [Candidatus Margulisiibacteriota bacterium]|nr:ubiquinol-cytochrome c reductase iron-sulfur subunit [Candidatus Margulisiibacteriota bacterium]
MTEEHSRRSFLGKLLSGSLIVGALGVVSSVVAYLFPPESVSSALGPQRTRVGKLSDLPVGEGKLALVNDEPVWVVHLAQGLVAMSALCTHQGCIVKWQPDRRLFSCPCHQGLFDARGNVVSGFPQMPLPRLDVGVVEGEVYISAGRARA